MDIQEQLISALVNVTEKMDRCSQQHYLAGYFSGLEKLGPLEPLSCLLLQSTQSVRGFQQDGLLSFQNGLRLIFQALNSARRGPTQEVKVSFFTESFQANLNQVVYDAKYFVNIALQREKCRKMEKESEDLFQKMLEREKKERIQRETKSIECSICMCDIQVEDYGLLECSHIFHRACLYEHIKFRIEANEAQINCPADGCMFAISPPDLREFTEGGLIERYEKMSFNRFVDRNLSELSWCPTAGCTAVFEFDELLDNYRCPVCKQHYCLKCRCNYHTGQSCAEYKISSHRSVDDDKFDQFVRGAKYKQCPNCKFWVQRTAGCVSMRCRCNIEFCYECGGIGCPHGSCSKSGLKK